MSAMSFGGMVMPSFLIKRNPWDEAASRTCCATSGEGDDMSITGIAVLGLFSRVMLYRVYEV